MNQFGICNVPAAPVRLEDSHRSEMVNQLVFGEVFSILEEKGEWLRIRSQYDGYEGWITWHLFESTSGETAAAFSPYVTAALVNQISWKGTTMHVPMGSFLTGFENHSGRLWHAQGQYEGEWTDNSRPGNAGSIIKTAQLWLNCPYLWGGKTLMGVDCSGFVQTVFKLAGISLQRDAYQQAEQGKAVESLDKAKKGDLAFFKNEKDRITHVGILMGNNQIIHAAGKVRIDPVDQEGIIHTETGKRTHHFALARRVVL